MIFLFGGLSPEPLIDDGLPERNARIELEGRRCVEGRLTVVERAGSDQSHGRIKAWRFGVASAQIMWPPARGRSL
jgi:hypothetical protein